MLCHKWLQHDYPIKTTTWLLRIETPSGNGSGKTVLANYNELNPILESGKEPTTVIGNVKLNCVNSVLDGLDWLMNIWWSEKNLQKYGMPKPETDTQILSPEIPTTEEQPENIIFRAI